MLGDLQVVAADRFDGAVAAAPAGKLDPDRLPAPGQLAEGEGELVAACGRVGCGPERGWFGGQGDRHRGTVADQVLGPVVGPQDEELRVAGDGGATEGAGAGEHHRVAADAAGELFPEHGGAQLGADRGHGLLFGLTAQAGVELRLKFVEHPLHRRRG